MRKENNGRQRGLFSSVRRIPQSEYEESSCAIRDIPSPRRERLGAEENGRIGRSERGKIHPLNQSRQAERFQR